MSSPVPSRKVALTATSTQDTKLIAVRPGEADYVEVMVQDAMVTVTATWQGPGVDGAGSPSTFTRSELLGPAGSKALFRATDGLSLTFTVAALLAADAHANPVTGAFTPSGGVRDAFVMARTLDERPEVEAAVPLVLSVAAAATAIIGFAPGYCRGFLLGHDRTQYGTVAQYKNDVATVLARRALTDGFTSPVSPQNGVAVENTGPGTMAALLTWLPTAPTTPAGDELIEIHKRGLVTAAQDTDITFTLPGSGAYTVEHLRVHRTAGAASGVVNVQFCGAAAYDATKLYGLAAGGGGGTVEAGTAGEPACTFWTDAGKLVIRFHVDVAGDTYSINGVLRRKQGSVASLVGA